MILGQSLEKWFDLEKTSPNAHYRENRETLRQLVAEGHEFGSHSFSHPHLDEISLAQIDEQMDRTSDLLHRTVGLRPRFMRAPYG